MTKKKEENQWQKQLAQVALVSEVRTLFLNMHKNEQ
jgi:hypothetical protein